VHLRISLSESTSLKSAVCKLMIGFSVSILKSSACPIPAAEFVVTVSSFSIVLGRIPLRWLFLPCSVNVFPLDDGPNNKIVPF